MANRVGSEHQSPSRVPIRLVGSVLLLGALLAWWGTRDHRRLFGESRRKPAVVALVATWCGRRWLVAAAAAVGIELHGIRFDAHNRADMRGQR